MNGYDFDETILKGNSVRSFFCYCMLRLPYLILYMPVLLLAVILNGLRLLSSDTYYNMLTKYIVFVPKREKFVKKFWDKNMRKIKGWYLEQQREDDIIISASPAYLVEEACSRLNVRCIATPYDLKKAKVIGGKHSYGAEKPNFYRDQFGDTPLETFYSDSMSDEPMFKLAKRGYLVKGDKITLIYENGVKLNNKE